MSTSVLVLAVVLLALVRGFFLLFPNVAIRSVWLKVCLITIVCVVAGFAWWSESADNLAPPLRLAPIILTAAIVFILTMPRGTMDEGQKQGVIEMLDTLVVAGVTALVIIAFIVRPFFIPSGSMEHTLEINDMVLVDELAYRFWNPARGDIVVFLLPPDRNMGDKDLIKRVIAVGGDTVEIRNGVTILNGHPVKEPFVYFRDPSPDFGPKTVPPNQLFCMGDHRDNSEDSRFWGFVPMHDVIGKAFCIFWPPSRIGRLR